MKRKTVSILMVTMVLLAGCSSGDGGMTSTTTTSSTASSTTTLAGTTTTTGIATTSTATKSTTSGTASTTQPAETTTPSTTTTDSSKTEYRVEVVRVIDGDTYEVEFPDGHTEDIRLLGVDTPEVHVANDPAEFEGIPTTEEGKQWLRDWGHKASEFARSTVGGKTVTIRVDEQADRRGSYGRLLVYVYTGTGKSVNERLIEQGYARMYDSQFSQRAEFASDEQTAQANNVGLWNFEGSSSDGDGSTGSQLSVSVHEDASGNDHDNLNEEYVTFTNNDGSSLDLSGWTVEDAAGHTYTVPSGFTLGAGESITLYTGSGSDSATELYWGSGSAVWNNGGDTIIVTNDDGMVVLKKEYA